MADASWISSSVVGGKRSSAPAPYFRKSFSLDKPVTAARLIVTALGLYHLEINGKRIGDEVFAPGWTDYNKRVQYQTYDVISYLQSGENALGAILGDGWYCGHVAWCGRQVYGDRPRLLARLEVTFEDGSTALVLTDSSWKTATGPILESDMLMGESHDARLSLGDWSSANYDDSKWNQVRLAPLDREIDFVPRVGPPVRRMGEIKPIKLSRKEPWNGALRIFDLGQNFSGRVRVRIKSKRGTHLHFRFAEVLNPDGSLYTENLRDARCTDDYTCGSEDLETWEPLFTFHGFRYVDVQGIQDDDVFDLTGIVLHSDTPLTGSFSCSHEGLTQLQKNIVWGQKSNFLEVPTDCPQRNERLGWTGDAQVFVRTAAFNMDVRGFFHKWMQDVRDAQSPAGAVPCTVPMPWKPSAADQDGGPAWSDATVICPWTIYLCYDDREILVENYDSMRRYMDFIGRERCRDHIRNHPEVSEVGFGDWLALDGGSRWEGMTPLDLIGTAFYAYCAELMSKIAEILSHPDDVAKYRQLHGNIVQAFQRRFITADGLLASGTQTAYVLALHFGLVDDSVRATAIKSLVRHVEKQKFHLATGFVGTPYILDVLEQAGHLDVAYKLLEQETFPSWLFPVRNGATTIWERWDGWTPEKGFQDKLMNSFNHYAYGAVGAWMYRTVAGLELDPQKPGYAHIIFRPRPAGSITWAEASLETSRGRTSIRWELRENSLEVQLMIPPTATATFDPPAGYDAKASQYGEGSHRLLLKKVG